MGFFDATRRVIRPVRRSRQTGRNISSLRLESLESRELLAVTLLHDVAPNSGNSNPSDFVSLGSLTFFTANDNSHGVELWKTDGTSAGTVMVKDIAPGAPSGFPQQLTVFQGKLYFTANDQTHGRELWVSDGTEAGTQLVADIDAIASSSPDYLTVVGDELLFSAYSPTFGDELWRFDGTMVSIVQDLRPGGFGSTPEYLTEVNGTLFFSANNTDAIGRELWKYDAVNGAQLVRNIADLSFESGNPQNLFALDDKLYFSAVGPSDNYFGRELYVSDGTSNGTYMVQDINPGVADSAPMYLSNVRGELWFSATTASAGRELWKSDGTSPGTEIVYDYTPGSGGSNPVSIVYQTAGAFVHYDTYNYLVYFPDAGPVEYRGNNLYPGQPLIAGDGYLYFSRANAGFNYELWQVNTTTRAVTLLQEVNPSAGSYPSSLAFTNGSLYFSANDGTQGVEPWIVSFNPVVTIDGLPSGNTGPEGTSIDVAANITAPGAGGPYTYAWSVTKQGAGSPFATGTDSTFSFTPDDNGAYNVALTVIDSATQQGTAQQSIVVTNVPPTAAIAGAPTSVAVGTPIDLTSNVTDPGTLDTHTYLWTVMRGATQVATGTNSSISFTPTEAGTYDVSFTATDDDLGSDGDSASITVFGLDFGDAPDTYKTLLMSDGARHIPSSLRLGTNSDSEDDGQPTLTALGDDDTGFADDEDGVTLPSTLYARTETTLTINASGAGKLDAWIDFNRDGVFDVEEKVANGYDVVAGDNSLAISVPDSAVAGTTFARFRISTAGTPLPTGSADDGEVEDYELSIVKPLEGTAIVIEDPEHTGPGNSYLLLINGSEAINDVIRVLKTSSTEATVYFGSQAAATFPLNSFDRILIFGRGGSDRIMISPQIDKASKIYGDAGNDRIYGGSGPDTFIGGEGDDWMTGRVGDDLFLGGAGSDTIFGGLDFDRIVEQPGAASATANRVRVGDSTDSYSRIELLEFTGTTDADSFEFDDVMASIVMDGRGGADTISYKNNGRFEITDSVLTHTARGTVSTVTMSGIVSATLLGGAAANPFTVTGWSRPLSIVGGGGSDTIEAANDVDFVLDDAFLQRTGLPNVVLESVERANLTGGASDNLFGVSGWTGPATLDGANGTDTLVVSDDVARMSLSNTALARTGRGRIVQQEFEAAELTGGARDNVINALNYTGSVIIHGLGGNDTLTGSSGYSIVLGEEGNDTLNAGSGQSVLVGGDGNDKLKVVGDPLGGIAAGHAILIGGAGRDQLTGGGGEDALIDSATSFDASVVDLAALLAHWTGGGTYADRAAQLTTDLTGQLAPDAESDTLRGGLDALDLFFMNLSGPSLEADLLLDLDEPPVEIVVANE